MFSITKNCFMVKGICLCQKFNIACNFIMVKESGIVCGLINVNTKKNTKCVKFKQKVSKNNIKITKRHHCFPKQMLFIWFMVVSVPVFQIFY